MAGDPRYLRLSLIALALSIACLAPIFCGCSVSRAGKVLNVGVVASGAWDLIETSKAEDRGGREANPLMGDAEWRRWSLKAVGASAVIGGAALLEIKGKPILAHLVRGIAIGAWTWAAVLNHGVGR